MSNVKMYETIVTIYCYTLRIPLSGGKAGRGHAKTSNVQVINTKTSTLEKNFYFTTKDYVSKMNAIDRAKNYCLTHLNKNA